ncbi:MAG TPA: universal stress protein [Candidatus Acidoferrales bacterium]|nr:universal stress protein [Candidatus Acidoferrales bacterium]
MATAMSIQTRIAIKNILFLTDFSEPSEAALPFLVSLARGYEARVHALHVLLPEPMAYATPESMAAALDAQDECAQTGKQRLEAQLAGVAHDVSIVRSVNVWEATEEAIRSCAADMVVVGTHGRTGAQKLLLGSIAEDIFRRSPVPVLTIGPCTKIGAHNAGRFYCVLFATDFTPHSLFAAPYAISLAKENQARLILFHVIRESERQYGAARSAVDASTQELGKIVPEHAELRHRPEVVLGYGEPAERILQVAREDHADLIVLGVSSQHLGAATHLGRAVAHKVVANAPCPVLTVRG